MSLVGIPYARADFNEETGEVVRVCPECEAEFVEEYDPAADMGCGAMVSGYADHYAEVHEA